MGHVNGKELYKKLGVKIDGLTVRAPWNDTFCDILKELYSPEEAELIIRMPYGPSTFERVGRVAHCEDSRLRRILESLCSKGLVVDLWLDGEYWYMPSPMVIGIFEMTMMRLWPNTNYKTWAKMFHEYLSNNDSFYAANFGHGERIIMRPDITARWEACVILPLQLYTLDQAIT